jgi:hypothetical protein
VLGLREEVGKSAAVNLGLASLAALQQALAGVVEGAVEQGEEGQGLWGQDLAVGIVNLAEDGNALEDGLGGSHGWMRG